jgi:hypothetical protein
MEFTKDGGFKVGETTLKTPIKVRVPDYGYELPEIHASSPLSMPVYTPMANVINWIERGINVEFCDAKGAEKTFFFIMEYNRFAKEENKKIESPEDQYRLVLNAQNRLYRELNFKHNENEKKVEESVPFISSLYKGNKQTSSENNSIRSSYNNPYINKSKPSKKKQKAIKERQLSPTNVRAFDMFVPKPDSLLVDPDTFVDIAFD